MKLDINPSHKSNVKHLGNSEVLGVRVEEPLLKSHIPDEAKKLWIET